MTLFSVLAFGFLLGMKHATEADHLAAVATLATRHGDKWDALRQGASWGLGHTLTLMLFGGIVMGLGRSIPPRFEQGLEMVVGLMLVILGGDVLRRLWRKRIHFHVHSHDSKVRHAHAHSHAGARRAEEGGVPVYAQMSFVPAIPEAHALSAHEHSHAPALPGRALLIGMMHGLAGSAALIVLSLGSVSSVVMGVSYIVLFGAGSILGMALLSLAIAVPLRLSGNLLTGLHRSMTAAIGLFSCGLGLWVIYRIGVVERLLLG